MPGIDGFETCRRLKADAETREIPVIFMTALADIQDKVSAFTAGGVDYVSKPFQVEELLARAKPMSNCARPNLGWASKISSSSRKSVRAAPPRQQFANLSCAIGVCSRLPMMECCLLTARPNR